MGIQWARVLYSVVITRQSNPPISQFNRPYNEFTSVWSMFVCTIMNETHTRIRYMGLYMLINAMDTESFPCSGQGIRWVLCPFVYSDLCTNRGNINSIFVINPANNEMFDALYMFSYLSSLSSLQSKSS